MKIERFNQINEDFGTETYYEIWYYDKRGDVQEYSSDEYLNLDPFDLKDTIKYFMELEKTNNVFIKKIIANKLSDKIINKIKLEIKTEKYNL